MPSWVPRLDFATTRFGDAAYLWLLLVPALLVVLWAWRVCAPAPRRGALPARPDRPGARAVQPARGPRLLVLRRAGQRAADRGAVAAADGRVQRAAGQRGPGDPAGRLGLDVRQGRAAGPLAALGPFRPHARRIPALAGRPRGAGAVRAAGGAAGAADQGPELAVLLRRSPGRAVAVSARERADLGHEHRGRHPLGNTADREGRGPVRQERQPQGVRRHLRRPGVERLGGRVAEGGASSWARRCTWSASAPRSAG